MQAVPVSDTCSNLHALHIASNLSCLVQLAPAWNCTAVIQSGWQSFSSCLQAATDPSTPSWGRTKRCVRLSSGKRAGADPTQPSCSSAAPTSDAEVGSMGSNAFLYMHDPPAHLALSDLNDLTSLAALYGNQLHLQHCITFARQQAQEELCVCL